MSRNGWMLFIPFLGLAGCDTAEKFEDNDLAVEAAPPEASGAAEAASDTLKTGTPQPGVESSTRPDALIVAPLSEWEYLDQDQATCKVPPSDWKTASTVDAGDWSKGRSELGYGDGDEKTEIDFGPSSSNKCITQYFRHTFSVDDPDLYSSLVVALLRDDGAAVYLNGTQIVRSNLPAGTLTPTTLASSDTDSEDRFFRYPGIDVDLLEEGENILAVEVHQRSKSNVDLSFDLELSGVLDTSNSGLLTKRIASREATIDEDRPNTELGGDSRCKADGESSAGDDQACLTRWDLSVIPSGATIRAVQIDASVVDSSSDRYSIFKLKSEAEWEEDEVTWNEINDNDPWTDGEFFSDADLVTPGVTVVNALSTGERLILLPPSLVEGWLAEESTNQGLAIYDPENENALHFAAGNAGLELVVTYEQ